MSDADLIYNAMLRAERRMEELMNQLPADAGHSARVAFAAIHIIREEIGNGLSTEGR